MKTFLVALFVLISGVMFTRQMAQDSPDPKPPVIEVYGTANIKVEPDIINWTVSINVSDDDLTTAKNEHDKSLSNVLELLKEKGLIQADIKTGGIRMTRNTQQYTKEKKYTVSNEVWFTVDDITKYDILTSELFQIENVYISGTYLEYSGAIETRIKAREDAINAAKKKAEEMAGVLGASIGKPILIQEEASHSGYYPNPFNVSTEADYGSTYSGQLFSKGTINVEAKVKVVFELINK
jgi:uncharacterized protein YggE